MIPTLFVSVLEQIVVQNIELTGSACQDWRSGDADLEGCSHATPSWFNSETS